MLLDLSTTVLQELADALVLKRICGIKPDAAETALKELQAAIQVAQLPKPTPPPGSAAAAEPST